MTRIPEEERLFLLSERDRVFWEQPGCVLAGMDEVGRGPLAGPVVVGLAVMPSEPLLRYVNDSKKVTEKRREVLHGQIRETALCCITAWVEPAVIDEINILEATKLAFVKAFEAANQEMPITDALLDALSGLNMPVRQHSLIHGDALSYSIACASIFAKVERDRYMIEMDKLYPQYGFARNKGYGTAEHIEAIKTYGPCPIHRRSFIQKWI